MAKRQTQELRAGTLNNAFIQSLDWNDLTTSLSKEFRAFRAVTDSWSASEPFALREMVEGSTNRYYSGDDASLQGSERGLSSEG